MSIQNCDISLLLDIVNEYKNAININYPKYTATTDDVFSVINEMVLSEYNFLSSDKKRLQTIKKYLNIILRSSFENVGCKNYMREIWGVFLESRISDYFVKLLSSEGSVYINIIKSIKYELIYWQGCEGKMHIKLDRILSYLN